MQKKAGVIGAMSIVALFSIGARQESNGWLNQAKSMYLHEDILYVSDAAQGIVLFDIAKNDPSHVATISLPGNSGIAVRDSIIYADSYGSILALRLQPGGSVDTVAKVFNNPQSEPWPMGREGRHTSRGWGCYRIDYQVNPVTPSAVSGGVGSSYAVFAVIDTFLYYVDGQSLVTMSIAQSDTPTLLQTTPINWDLETLFATSKFLFIGASSGMYIMDRSNPELPRLIGSFVHANGCDPVVVQDTIAYVTLRGGNRCGTAQDELYIISIADPTNPRLLGSHTPRTPYGLSVSDTLLYVAKGYNGYSLYSVADPYNPITVSEWDSHTARDFIWTGKRLYVMGFGDVLIFDVNNPQQPKQVGRIE